MTFYSVAVYFLSSASETDVFARGDSAYVWMTCLAVCTTSFHLCDGSSVGLGRSLIIHCQSSRLCSHSRSITPRHPQHRCVLVASTDADHALTVDAGYLYCVPETTAVFATRPSRCYSDCRQHNESDQQTHTRTIATMSGVMVVLINAENKTDDAVRNASMFYILTDRCWWFVITVAD